MNDEIAIKVEGVNKTFRLPHEKRTSIKSAFVSLFRRQTFEKQHVLNNVSFEIKKGEFFGIVGRNGSGKSTLLKMLAGIYSPSKGSISINGSLTPFIELGVGFNPELTGRENVYLNGALLGFSHKEMEAMYEEIVEFAELEKFMDQKLKNYSSGMQVRLAFSIAIRANNSILLLDEVLAVGDEAFQQKCTTFFEKISNTDKTVILVTHDMSMVNRFCKRAMLIENGEIKSIGRPDKIAKQYSLDNSLSSPAKNDKELSEAVKVLEINPISPRSISNDENLEFEIIYELSMETDVVLAISLEHEGRSVIQQNSKDVVLGRQPNTRYRVTYKTPISDLLVTKVGVNVAIFSRNGFRLIGFNSKSLDFLITPVNKEKGGIVVSRGKWTVQEDASP